jgi:hypothetical protein
MTRCRWRWRRCELVALAAVERADHVTVLRLLAQRNADLGRSRNLTACRLHALLTELVSGGMASEIYVSSAQAILAKVKPVDPVIAARRDLALEHLDDLRRLDAQLKDSKRRITTAVAASGTTLSSCSAWARSWPAWSSATAATCADSPPDTSTPCTTGPPPSTCRREVGSPDA